MRVSARGRDVHALLATARRAVLPMRRRWPRCARGRHRTLQLRAAVARNPCGWCLCAWRTFARGSGATPVYIAGERGHVDTLKLLFRAQADVNKKQTDGWSPLHNAARRA